jgi:hypothetical protein
VEPLETPSMQKQILCRRFEVIYNDEFIGRCSVFRASEQRVCGCELISCVTNKYIVLPELYNYVVFAVLSVLFSVMMQLGGSEDCLFEVA